MRRLYFLIYVCVYVCVCVCMMACREQQLTTDSSARLTFSADTINFDTIFTSFGSSTHIVTVRNPNANAVRISRVWWQKGEHFFANLDGENNTTRWEDIDLYGGDSLYLFVRAEIDPYGSNSHPIEVDTLYFEVNGNRQSIAVQAYGMDVNCIRTDSLCSVYPQGLTLTADKPYLIFDTLIVNGKLTIKAGATLYMHPTANILAYGDVEAEGTLVQPIRVMGDRTDYLFPKVPYRVASGQWGGLYFFRLDTICGGTILHYDLENIHLLSGQLGLYCYSDNKERRARLRLHNARIHNMSAYGLVLENTDAEVSNAEISNCASFGMFLCGGTHRVEHTSVANYFGYPYTTINIHSAKRDDVAAAYVLASSYDMAPSNSSFYNCIFTGAVKPSFVIDSIPQSGYPGEVKGCYLNCDSDSIRTEWRSQNTFAQEKDTVFKNTYYKYGEYIYYDFHLSDRSKARKIGLPLESLQLDIANDLDNNPRDQVHPDAGCYSNQ